MDILEEFFNRSQSRELAQWARGLDYRWGEADQPGGTVTGMVSDLDPNDPWVQQAQAELIARGYSWARSTPQRAYVNCFQPGELPRWHRDGNVWTLLIYCTERRDPRFGGETQFMSAQGDRIEAVCAQQGRAVVFDGEQLHRATAFWDQSRFTLAIKWPRS